VDGGKNRVGVILCLTPAERFGGEPVDKANEMLRTAIGELLRSLSERFSWIEFAYAESFSFNDSVSILKELGDVTGYLVFNINMMGGVLRPILLSGKPAVVLSETYVGSGEFLMEYSRALSSGMPVVGFSMRGIPDVEQVAEYVNLLDVVHKLSSSKMLVIVDEVTKDFMWAEDPICIDMCNISREVQSITGIDVEYMTIDAFKEKYYEPASIEEARKVAERWLNNAARVDEHSLDDLVAPARLYLAMKKALIEHGAAAISFDDIHLVGFGLLDAWPCLGFMELAKEGFIGVCEGDVRSGAIMLLMKYLANVPGFISDPAIDMRNGEVVYYHCYAPINPYGFDSTETCPYTIRRAHFLKQRVDVELPLNKVVTVVGLDPANKAITVHTAETVGHEHGPIVCATQLVAKANTEALARNWVWGAGWHRVVFYGDWKGRLKTIAQLLGLKVVEEDKE